MVSSQSLSDYLQITVGLTKEHGGLSWFHFVCELNVIGWGEGGGQGGPTNTCSIDVFFCNERPIEFSKKDFNMFMLGHQAISTTQVI